MSVSGNLQVNFADGEGLIYSDLIDMQDYSRHFVVDSLVGGQSRALTSSGSIFGTWTYNNPNPTDQSAYCFTSGDGGYIIAVSGTACAIDARPGLIGQYTTGSWLANFGPEAGPPQQLLFYDLAYNPPATTEEGQTYIKQTELYTIVQSGSTSGDRYDAIDIKLSFVSGTLQTRDFIDQSTGLLTSQQTPKQRFVTLTSSYTMGTPGSNQLPALQPGWARWAAIKVPVLSPSTQQLNPRDHVMDFTVPTGGETRYVVQGFQIYADGRQDADYTRISGSMGILQLSTGSILAYAACPDGSPNRRLSQIRLWTNCQTVKLATPVYNTVETGGRFKILSASLGTLGLPNGQSTLFAYQQFIDNTDVTKIPLWANGLRAGRAGDMFYGISPFNDTSTLVVQLATGLAGNANAEVAAIEFVFLGR